MSGIGDDVVVLRRPMVRKGGRGLAVLLILGPIVLTLVIVGAEMAFHVPSRTGHLPLIAAAVMVGAFSLSALIALPGLLMRRQEQLTEELHVDKLGMELRQVLPGVAAGQPVVSWRVDWADVSEAKLRYRASDRTYEGVDIRTRSGLEQRLYATGWEPVAGMSPADTALRRSVTAVDSDALRASSLVQALTSKGLQIEDDTQRPQDRLAAQLGLGLAAVAIIAALVFNYFVEH